MGNCICFSSSLNAEWITEKEFANPLVCPHTHLYIESSDSLSEFYQAERIWADFKKTPYRHFYIKEVARLDDGTFVIPMKWVHVVQGNVRTDCVDVMNTSYDKAVSNLKVKPK